MLRDAGGPLSAATLARGGAGRDALRRLERRGLVALRRASVDRRPRRDGDRGAGEARRAQPGPDRRRGTDRRRARRRGGDELLLHGVTGSGKTEVYLAAAEAALERGRGAIVLVPEIALTPQTLVAVRSRGSASGSRSCTRSSGPASAATSGARLRRGEARICVGPRSAVFAPVERLGLIVVDEEHDPSYKQESDPRYDAREVARRRAAQAGAVLVLGTATPRPESWHALERLELPERVDGRPLPPVEVLDMRGRAGAEGPLHPRTREALEGLRREGGKAIVLLNRRGWSPVPVLPVLRPRLAAARTATSRSSCTGSAACVCHHCGHREPEPDSCPACGSTTLARTGAGTERIESVIAEAGRARCAVFRLDSDSAARSGAHLEILGAFAGADSGVLVGTQMVAKGHDFPDVVLGVVLDADATLRFPDFRAEERTFALVAQLAGRSGRGPRGGRVIVQTTAPDAAAIRHAAAHDAAGFLAGELERRRELGYPPFSHLIRVGVAGERAAEVEAAAALLRERLDATLPPAAVALGPAPRFRLRGRERRQVMIKAGDRVAAVAAVREVVDRAAAARELRDVALSVDVAAQ